MKNLTTGEQTKISKRDCEIYNADNPNDVDLLRAIVATDSGKHVIEEILDEYNTAQGPFCTVRWFGGDTEIPRNHSILSDILKRINDLIRNQIKENVNLLNPTRKLGLSLCLSKSVIRR
ncbi:hypothetical protein P9112_008383 [Eukaryota sp. TZLM1-RC]